MVSGADGVRPHGGSQRPNDDRAVPGQEAATAPPQPSPLPTGRFPGLDSARHRAMGAGGVSRPERMRHSQVTPSNDGVALARRSQQRFLDRIGNATRASEVVPSLFTRHQVPQEVVQRFAEAYARELEPERGARIARHRYATLSQLAEDSGLSRHLGFPYGVLNISLDFDNDSNAYVEACSARLADRSQFLVGDGHGAHQTAHQLPIDMRRRDEVLARIEKIVKRAGTAPFTVRATQHRVNPEGMAEVFYAETESERRQWVAAANPFIGGLKDFAVMPVTTPPGRIIDDAFIDAQSAAADLDVLFNLHYAGFAEIPSVREGGIGMEPKSGSRFNPHSTYGKLWEPPSTTMVATDHYPIPNLPPAHEGGGTVNYVSVYEMGPNGTVRGDPLLRLELPRT